MVKIRRLFLGTKIAMTLRKLITISWLAVLWNGQEFCRAGDFPNAPSAGNEASATEIRVVRKGKRFSFLARNTTYAEALPLLATLAGKKVTLDRVPSTPLIVEY